MAKNLSPEEFADKQARNLVNSLEDVKRGISNVSTAPTQKAAANSDKYLQGVQRGVDKWKRGLNRVSLEEWKDKALTKGVARIPDGISAARNKVVQFAQEFLPFQATITEKVRKMPNVTLEDGIQRAIAQMRETAKFVRKG